MSVSPKDPLIELNNEYIALQQKYKDNYEIVDFYPYPANIVNTNIGCASKSSPLQFKKLDNKLHTPESCKVAVSISNPRKLEYDSKNKKQGLFCTIKFENGSTTTHTATDFNTLYAALNNNMPNSDTSYTATWKGVIVPDVDGDWSIEIKSNDTFYLWMGSIVYENMTEYNATLTSNNSKNLKMSKNHMVPICIQWNKTTMKAPTFSLIIRAPATSVYSDSKKMFDCLFSYMNTDDTLYEPSPLYYSLVENSSNDTKQNLFQCHYSTSLNGTKIYDSSDVSGGFYISTEDVVIPTTGSLPNKFIKPGNSMKIDSSGVHIFNSQNVAVKTLVSMAIPPELLDQYKLKLISSKTRENTGCVLFLMGPKPNISNIQKNKNRQVRVFGSASNIPNNEVRRSQKWNMERQANNISDTASEIYFGKPLISEDCVFKLSFNDTGNYVLQVSKAGCQNVQNVGTDKIRYSTSDSNNQYIYNIQLDEKQNQTYFVDKQDKKMQYLPRDNPMLSYMNTYTRLDNYVPSSDIIQSATNVKNDEECKKMCNDNSGCSWYYAYADNRDAANTQKCLIGTSVSKSILSPDLINPMESVDKISSASLNIRNKNILPNKEYMFENIVPMQLSSISQFENYAEYSVDSTPIDGTQKLGFISEKDVQEYFEKQRNILNPNPMPEPGSSVPASVKVNENFSGMDSKETQGIAIIRPNTGKLSDIQKKLDNLKQVQKQYNTNLSQMQDSRSQISDYIQKYESAKVDIDENENDKYNYYRPKYVKGKKTLISGINEDNEEIIRQQRTMYFTTGIAIITLGIAGVMIASRVRS